MNISGQNVIITGGTGGIGAALCRELLKSDILVCEIKYSVYFPCV